MDTAFNDARSRRCSEDISVRWDDEGVMWLFDRLMKSEQSKTSTFWNRSIGSSDDSCAEVQRDLRLGGNVPSSS